MLERVRRACPTAPTPTVCDMLSSANVVHVCKSDMVPLPFLDKVLDHVKTDDGRVLVVLEDVHRSFC